jgi:serine/threonine protein kinase KIN1/2
VSTHIYLDILALTGVECKHLISRMLVTDPKQRASLAEVMNHGWMTKGFNGPPENFLPHREALQLPLDQSVIEKMTGFDFGPPDYIQRELTRIIESEEYQAAAAASHREPAVLTPSMERKRGVFDFYKRRNSSTSKDALTMNPSAEAVNVGPDPVVAFSPLLSIYYLAREKQERERAEANPGALSMPISPGEKPLKLPDLPAPEAAYTNSNTYEIPGEGATGGRSRPRARTQGEDDAPDPEQLARPSDAVSPSIVTTPAPTTPTTKRESVAGGLLRRFSTRRGKDGKEYARPGGESQPPGSLTLQPPSAGPPRKSFSVRKPRTKDPTSPMIHSAGSQPQQTTLLTPPLSAGGVLSRAGNRVLGRSTSVNSADRRRRPEPPGSAQEILTTVPAEPPPTSSSDKSSLQAPKVKISEPPTADKPNPPRSATTTRTKSLGHARRESIQARRARRGESRQTHVPEETDQELAEGELTDSAEGGSEIKPVFLKGFFSASTTSTKPLSAIRADIIRVLKELGVEYSEIKGGFSCRHAPSIDLAQMSEKTPTSPERPAVATPTHRRRISFGGLRASDREREESRDSEKPARSSSRRRPPDASFTNSDDSDEERSRRRPSERPPGETTTHVQNDMGENMVLVFEIIIVKVPLISIHGIQFKKVDGGTWQYKNMAQKILDALRL